MTRDLSRLLRPRSVAFIGGGWAAAALRQTQGIGFSGDLWPVHPTKDHVEGVPAFRSVGDLPEAPDAVFIGVNRNETIEIVRALAARGAGGAVCFASGFREAGSAGDDLQRTLVDAAGNMPILGPNCYGFINYCDGVLLWPDQHGGMRLAEGQRGAAILTQSSNIAINMTMQTRGLPLSFVMTAGNQAQTGLSEMALGLIEDERVAALGLHIEGFDSVAGFERLAARARELNKPVVAMKVGHSEQARVATISHTASLAGSSAASDAFLARLGIAQLHSIPAFLEALKLVTLVGPLPGFAISSMSCSGGEASVMADSAVGAKVNYPPMTEDHAARVSATLGPLVAMANPLDYHTFIWNKPEEMRRAFTAFVSGGYDFNILVMDFPRNDRCSDTDWWSAVDAFADALAANGAKGGIVASLPENLPEGHAARLFENGIVPLHGIDDGLWAIEAAATIGAAWAKPLSPPLVTVQRGGKAVVTLSEADAKVLLAAHGLPVSAGRSVASAEAAIAAADEIGYPVAVKALGLAHKSEHGAVRLNLRADAAVRQAASDLLALSPTLYVERMIAGGVAELIAGVVDDPLFGPVLTVGTGGVLVELLDDIATLLLPATRGDIEAALRGLKLFRLLDGYRGRPKADLDAALDTLCAIADFAVAHAGRLVEMDINPVIVCGEGQGAWLADALMVMEGEGDD